MSPLYPSFCNSLLAFVNDSFSYGTQAFACTQQMNYSTYRLKLHQASVFTSAERLSSSSQALCTARPSSVLELNESWYPPGTCRCSRKGQQSTLVCCAVLCMRRKGTHSPVFLW